MPDTEHMRLIGAARDRAISGFVLLFRRSLEEAEAAVARDLSDPAGAIDRETGAALLRFLQRESGAVVRLAEALYRRYLERAIDTMYVDFRQEFKHLSADELSLIDDEAMNRQMEISCLAQRIRDVCEQAIGRLNLAIASIHGQHDARERENPFRPYLLARAAYESILDTAPQPEAALLFERFSTAVPLQLEFHFEAILKLFETGGVAVRYEAMRSRGKVRQHHYGLSQSAGFAAAGPTGSEVLPRLELLLESLHSQSRSASGPQAAAEGTVPARAEELMRRLFLPGKVPGGAAGSMAESAGRTDSVPGAPAHGASEAAGALRAKLAALRNETAPGEATESERLAHWLENSHADPHERLVCEVVGMLIDHMLVDAALPETCRPAFEQLRLPLLQLALDDARLLQDRGHPARRLLNRLGSAAVGIDDDPVPERAIRDRIVAAIDAVTRHALPGADDFARALEDFEQSLRINAPWPCEALAAALPAQSAEKIAILRHHAAASLRGAMLDLNRETPPGLEPLLAVWPDVLAHAAWRDAEGASAGGGMVATCRAVLPELVWSTQEKSSAADRTALIRLLPGLVKRITEALAMIGMPEQARREVLDRLVDIHTRVLRAPQKNTQPMPTLDALHDLFAEVAAERKDGAWDAPEPPDVDHDLLVRMTRRSDATIELLEGKANLPASDAERHFLDEHCRPACRFDRRITDDRWHAFRLAWSSNHRGLHLFLPVGAAIPPLLATHSSVLAACRKGDFLPAEEAPLFERAVQAMKEAIAHTARTTGEGTRS